MAFGVGLFRYIVMVYQAFYPKLKFEEEFWGLEFLASFAMSKRIGRWDADQISPQNNAQKNLSDPSLQKPSDFS